MEWISVKDRLPEAGKRCCVVFDNPLFVRTISEACYSHKDKKWYFLDHRLYDGIVPKFWIYLNEILSKHQENYE